MTRHVVASICAFVLAACSGGSSSSGPTPPQGPFPPPTTPTPTSLGNIEAEQDYQASLGGGTVDIRLGDPTTPDPCCFASIQPNGRRLIQTSPQFATFSGPVQSFFMAHEFGHHYLRHEATGGTRQQKEFMADAYATRVVAANEGVNFAQLAIQAIAAQGSPPTPTHPASQDRASYAQQVLSAFLADPTQVPNPPSDQPTGTTPGQLIVQNIFSEAVIIGINGQIAGSLAPGGIDGTAIAPGQYLVELAGYFSGTLYFATSVTIEAGQTVRLP